MRVNVEVTDTFGGEANYAWVRRASFDAIETMSHYSIVRRAKHLIGWSGKKCSTVRMGDDIELRPYGECQVAFITFGE